MLQVVNPLSSMLITITIPRAPASLHKLCNFKYRRIEWNSCALCDLKMDPFLSQRRPRLHPEDVPEVIEGLRLRLLQYLKTRNDIYGATVSFRAFYRLSTYRKGRPGYPSPVTWGVIESFVNDTILRGDGGRTRPKISSNGQQKLRSLYNEK